MRFRMMMKLNISVWSTVLLRATTAVFIAHHASAQASQESPTAETNDTSAAIVHEIIDIELSDGDVVKGRLSLPAVESSDEVMDATNQESAVGTIVIFVHGTGPGTYLTKRSLGEREFNYFDYFAEAFADRGIAFFSYNKRGVTLGTAPPWFDEIDRDTFRKVVPHVEADDLGTIIETLKRNERLSQARVMLLGSSEGTIDAPLAAEKHPDLVDGLLLAGYCHDNLFDIIKWQFTGHGSMLKINPMFDADDDGTISREEYESSDEQVARYRRAVFRNATFELLDATEDGRLDAADFAIRNQPMRTMLLYNVEHDNEDWIWHNYFRISVPWLREHFALEPNKTRLLRLDLPIYVFHGTEDAHLDVKNIEDLKKRFTTLGKTNLEAFVFPDHDHDLNFMEWVTAGEMSEGVAKIFEVVEAFDDEDR